MRGWWGTRCGVWRPEVDVRFLYLASQVGLGIPCLCLSCVELHLGHHTHTHPFPWVLGIQTLTLVLIQQAFYLLNSLPKSPLHVFQNHVDDLRSAWQNVCHLFIMTVGTTWPGTFMRRFSYAKHTEYLSDIWAPPCIRPGAHCRGLGTLPSLACVPNRHIPL